jgi:L-ribulokinase
VVNCGGISVKNPLAMQIYADVLDRPLEISRSTQTCALGSAMAGAVVAGRAAGGHDDFAAAAKAMTGTLRTAFKPRRADAAVYARLYRLYRKVHDAFGTKAGNGDLYPVMKDLLSLRDEIRARP